MTLIYVHLTCYFSNILCNKFITDSFSLFLSEGTNVYICELLIEDKYKMKLYDKWLDMGAVQMKV